MFLNRRVILRNFNQDFYKEWKSTRLGSLHPIMSALRDLNFYKNRRTSAVNLDRVAKHSKCPHARSKLYLHLLFVIIHEIGYYDGWCIGRFILATALSYYG